MPSVAILSLLCEHCGAAPPKENEIRRWRSKYLKVYDSEIDGLGPKNDFKSKRRQVIAQTFERLQQQSNEFWNRGK